MVKKRMAADQRPILKIAPERLDKVLAIAGWSLMTLLWYIVLTNYGHLPETIPIHFNAGGEADSYGGRSGIFILPVAATALFIVLTILARYPHLFNYPVAITEENAARNYRYAIRLLNIVKTTIVIVFGFIAISTINVAGGRSAGLGHWFAPVTLILIFTPVVFFTIKIFRKN